MPEPPHELDYASPRDTAMGRIIAHVVARVGIIVAGIALPYLARLVGVPWNGRDWLTSYPGTGFLVTAPIWGAILLLSLVFRSILALAVAATIGFAGPFYVHATYVPSADAQEGIRFLFTLGMFGFPSILLGWLIGVAIDWARHGDPDRPPDSTP